MDWLTKLDPPFFFLSLLGSCKELRLKLCYVEETLLIRGLQDRLKIQGLLIHNYTEGQSGNVGLSANMVNRGKIGAYLGLDWLGAWYHNRFR